MGVRRPARTRPLLIVYLPTKTLSVDTKKICSTWVKRVSSTTTNQPWTPTTKPYATPSFRCSRHVDSSGVRSATFRRKTAQERCGALGGACDRSSDASPRRASPFGVKTRWSFIADRDVRLPSCH